MPHSDIENFNPYPLTIIFCLENVVYFFLCCIYSIALQARFVHGANHMNPNQSAPNIGYLRLTSADKSRLQTLGLGG